MKKFSKYVGLDVHKETVAVSVAEVQGGEVRYFGEIANTPEAIEKLVRQLRKGDANLSLSRGGITKTGNGHVRRVLVEAAWTYRHQARKTAILQRRAERTSSRVRCLPAKTSPARAKSRPRPRIVLSRLSASISILMVLL